MITSPIPTNQNVIYRFRGKVALDTTDGITLHAFADSRYKLYINGKYVAEGPAMATENYYDEFSSNALCVGENEIEAEVLYAGGTLCLNGLTRDRAVAFSLTLLRNGEIIAETDDTWETALDTTRRFYRYKEVHANGVPNEYYDKVECTWEPALKYRAAYYGEMEDKTRKNWGCFGIYQYIKKNFLPFHTPEGKHSFTISKPMTSGLSVGDVFTGMTVKAGETCDVVLSAGVHTVGYPTFNFSGKGKVTVVYAEGYRHEGEAHGRTWYLKYRRDDTTGEICDDPTDFITLDGGELCFTPYMHRVFRFVRLTVEAETDVTVGDASFAIYRYPLSEDNDFTCSDERYNKIYENSKRTLRNCMLDTYVDCSFYEMIQYVQDAYLEMAYTLFLSSDYRMPQKLMLDTWQTRDYEGMMTAGAPMNYKMVTPTNCIYFLAMSRDYLLHTGDEAFVRPFLPAFYDILDWYKKIVNEDGVIGVFPYGCFIDWVNDWVKDGWDINWFVPHADKHPASIYSLTYLFALKTAIPLFRRFGREGIAKDLETDYDALLAAINRIYFDEKRGLYKDLASGGYSEHSQIFAVLSGAVTGDAGRALLANCNASDVAKCSFGYRYFKNRAIEMLGLPLDMEEFLTDWYKMLDDGATTFFEFPGFARSDCHGWSATPICEFTTRILGLTPAADGISAVNVAPTFYHLTHASGTLPTMDGGVHLTFRKEGDVYRVTVDSPTRIEKRIRMKDGSTYVTTDAHVEYTV